MPLDIKNLQQPWGSSTQDTKTTKPQARTTSSHAPVLLLGLGNSIMGDDGVGLYVLRRLKQIIPPSDGLEFKEVSIGGIKLVEEILDYKTVFIIDSIESPTTIGNIHEFSPEQFNNALHESTPHTTNFITALELYKKLELKRVPETIRIFTIDIDPHYTFSETLSPKVQEAAAKLTELVAREIRRTLS